MSGLQGVGRRRSWCEAGVVETAHAVVSVPVVMGRASLLVVGSVASAWRPWVWKLPGAGAEPGAG